MVPETNYMINNNEDEIVETTAVSKQQWRKPKKAHFRQRAHCNPLSDSFISYPPSPDHVDWSCHYPNIFGREDVGSLYLNTYDHPIAYNTKEDASLNGKGDKKVRYVDVGCGFGGLLVALAPMYPDTLMLGMEIREKVTSFVGERIRALRSEYTSKTAEMTGTAGHHYDNISIIRTNAAKFLVHYFRKSQITKVFFCFPDPQFKRSNFRRRIINPSLLSMYAYVMSDGGLVYTVTDVEALYHWIRACFASHPLFEEVPSVELEQDCCATAITEVTEEGKKVARNGGPRLVAVFRRCAD